MSLRDGTLRKNTKYHESCDKIVRISHAEQLSYYVTDTKKVAVSGSSAAFQVIEHLPC